jgi:hypothetical protein
MAIPSSLPNFTSRRLSGIQVAPEKLMVFEIMF